MNQCTDAPDAFGGSRPVYEELGAELRAMVGEDVYDQLRRHLDRRLRRNGTEVFLPHPATRTKRNG